MRLIGLAVVLTIGLLSAPLAVERATGTGGAVAQAPARGPARGAPFSTPPPPRRSRRRSPWSVQQERVGLSLKPRRVPRRMLRLRAPHDRSATAGHHPVSTR